MSTVLIVEDGETDRVLLTEYLQKAGIVVFIATNAEEAQTKIQQNRPDLIVLDVMLPNKSGFEICRELKKNPDTKAIPVIMSSSKATQVDKTWGTMLGADAYLPKPVDRNELIETIRQLIGK